MRSFFLVRSNNGYCYGYNIVLQELFVFDPLTCHIIEQKMCGITLSPSEEITVDGRKYNSAEIQRTLEYINLLENRGVFQHYDFHGHISQKLTGEIVRESLYNTRQICFEVTEACNLSCSYCIYGDLYNHEVRAAKKMPLKMGITLIDFMLSIWNKGQQLPAQKIISFYGGEPLMNIKFIKAIVAHVNNIVPGLGIDIQFDMTTNGTLLQEHIEFLVANDFSITISLDGDENHNQHRVFNNTRRPSFKRVFDNIIYVKNTFPEYFEKNVKFNSVIHSKSDYLQVKAFFRKELGKDTNISELNPLISNAGAGIYRSVVDGVDYDAVIEQGDRLPDYQSKFKFLSLLTSCRYNRYSDILSEFTSRFPTGTCVPFNRRLFATVDGKIFPCETVPHNHPLGWLTEGSVDIDCDYIAEMYNRLFDKHIDQCKICYNYKSCPTCVFYEEIKQSKCNYFFSYDSFKKYLTRNIEFFEKHPSLISKLINNVHNI